MNAETPKKPDEPVVKPALFRLKLINIPFTGQVHFRRNTGGAFLSRHGRMVRREVAAAFRSERVAQHCLDLWMHSLRRRWGKDIAVQIEAWTDDDAAAQDPANDGAMLIARARSECFSAQVVPEDALRAAHLELWQLEGSVGDAYSSGLALDGFADAAEPRPVVDVLDVLRARVRASEVIHFSGPMKGPTFLALLSELGQIREETGLPVHVIFS